MIVDDSNIIRNRIQRAYDSNEFMLVASASSGVIEKLVAIDPNVRILVVSALSDKSTGIQALSLGASGFLCKPFSEDDLLEALRELVSDD